MINQDVAQIFKEMSSFYEMNDDGFRSRAYEKGAAVVEILPQGLSEIYKKQGLKGLEDLSGIGQGMAEKIEEFIKTGHIKEYERLKKKMPVDMEELTAVEGLGPKGVGILYKKLKIRNLKGLEKAARAGKIRKLEGFGKISEQNILDGVEFVKKHTGRMLFGYAWFRVQELISEFQKMKEVIDISPAGSLRRRKETIGDIDILVTTKKPKKIIEHFVSMPDVVKVWGKGSTKASIRVKAGFDMDLRVVPKESWGAALQYFTGSKAHNIKVRQIAIDKGLKLNEYGVFRGKKRIAGKTEEEIYKAIGLKYLEPEIREDTGEIEAAKARTVPALIEYGSLLGDLQVQTDWTDGEHSIEEMAKEAKRLGLKYIAITDHTKSLAMTGGADEKKLLRQMKEIDRINTKISGIKILKGAEVNILKDGTLDIDDDTLAKLDVVGVAVHSFFKMSKRDMTERIIRAMQNPNVDILFHPTGRLIQKRQAYDLDIEKIIKEAVKTNTILEINAFPDRLDLKDEHIRIGIKAAAESDSAEVESDSTGAKFVINSDAHNKEHFKYLEFGIAQARRGWATASDIINTLPLNKFLACLKK